MKNVARKKEKKNVARIVCSGWREWIPCSELWAL